MGAPGTVSLVVRERGRGDADVVEVEERNEHEQREMGASKCERWDGAQCTAAGSLLWVALALPQHHRETDPGAKIGHHPAARLRFALEASMRRTRATSISSTVTTITLAS
jgi:hypothetical protein